MMEEEICVLKGRGKGQEEKEGEGTGKGRSGSSASYPQREKVEEKAGKGLSVVASYFSNKWVSHGIAKVWISGYVSLISPLACMQLCVKSLQCLVHFPDINEHSLQKWPTRVS